MTETDRLWCGTETDLVAGPEDVLGQRLGVLPARHGVAVLGPVDDLVPFQAPSEVFQRGDLLVLKKKTWHETGRYEVEGDYRWMRYLEEGECPEVLARVERPHML